MQRKFYVFSELSNTKLNKGFYLEPSGTDSEKYLDLFSEMYLLYWT